MIELTIPGNVLEALKLFVDADDFRESIRGINLEISANKVLLVATNGHILGVYRLEVSHPEIDQPLSILIPYELLKPFKAKDQVSVIIGERVDPNSCSHPLTLSNGTIEVKGNNPGNPYPKFRNVFPTEVSREAAQFDARLITIFGKAYNLLQRGKLRYQCVGIGHNGRGAALLDLGDPNFIGCIMPLRESGPTSLPEWL